MVEAPTGPRATSYGSDFRGDFGYRGDFRGGRGRGGRGRGWRDDSRDRAREPEREYRDRRDDRGPPREPFRDDRGRDRDRWDRDAFRGRRQSSPQGRGRSPNYGPRDTRETPSNLDLDRARRGSRDAPLSTGSPSSDSLQPFVRGYGRARGGRGRGRGGYYEDYHRAPGRSRSPDLSWTRRTQPSATPPPQVPAFGSTSSNLPIAATNPTIPTAPASELVAGPLPGVSVPTAPRAHASKPQSHIPFGRPPGGLTSKKWVRPEQGSPELRPEIDQPYSPHTRSPAALYPLQDVTKLSRDVQHQEKEPQNDGENLRPADRDTERISTPKFQPDLSTQEPPRKRRPIIGKRAPKIPVLALHDISDDGSDSDSGDDLDDNYFEDEITKVKDEIAKVTAENPLVPRAEPPAFFLKPFLDSNIDEVIAAYKSTSVEECTAPLVEASPAPDVPTSTTSLAPKPRNKRRSRPTTPLLESETKLKLNGKDSALDSDSLASAKVDDPANGRHAPSIIVPPAAARSTEKARDVPDQVLGTSIPVKTLPNGRKSAPMMDQFDDSEDEQSVAERLESLAAVRKAMKTPPLTSLPNFNCKPWHQDEQFLKSLMPNPVVEANIRKNLEETKARRLREQDEERERWQSRYYEYRRWTDFSDDEVAVCSREKFAKSRAKAAAEAAAPPPSSVPSAGAKPEGQRRTGSRFATEHDIERVLRESEQEAKETKEREERVARAKTASAKEATIPDMYWDEEERLANTFIDNTHLVPFERSFAILEFGEPIDNFTEEEAEIFERYYMEFPKQWGKIAEALPRRDYKACIQHYYLVKHSSSLKEKLKKHGKKRGRKARKGPNAKTNALMADLGNRDETEETPDAENGGERRRPRRAAAPTWPIETPQSESEVASPAPTPGRKPAATPKGETSNETPNATKKKAKVPREKGTKQSKNSQLLAAAPIAAANRRDESPATPSVSAEWKNRRESTGPPRFPPQYDGAGQSQSNFAPPYAPPERPNPTIPVNFDVMQQPFPSQERLGSAPPPVSFDAQQDRRNIQQTSSYWSVPEQTDFPALLKHFGTDWHGIAKWMTSKTHIMVYTTVFQQWLTVPSDSNKSRRVANIQTQVKNYYQRQVDSGKMKEWEEIAKEADEKRERGEPTGPLPTPTVLPKRRYEVTPGSVPRAGSAIDGLDDIPSAGQNAALQQPSPPQVSLGSRFAPLAQAGPLPHQPATPTSVMTKHLPPQPIQQAPPQVPQQVQQQQARPPRAAPPLGYFTADRPIIQAEAVSKRSLQAAQEAQIERSTALRLEREQREQQQQQQAMQRERQFQMKQENEQPNPHQYEPYSQPIPAGNMVAQSRIETPQPSAPTPSDLRRTAPPPQQYQPRGHQAVRSLLGENGNVGREIKSTPSPAIPRAPMSAPPANHEPYSAPPQPAPITAVRQQETTRKTSNIMALLNDESSEPRPAPLKRVSDVSSSSMQASQTPPPQHALQPSRYAAHSSQPTSQPPQQMSQQIPQQMPQQMAPQPPPQQLPQAQNPYSQPSHPTHQHSGSVGHPRSYTPNSFETRAYAPPTMQQQQQQMYSQPPRQSMPPQAAPLRREPSLSEVHGVSSGYARSSAPSQSTMRLKESPYSATPPPSGPQGGRQQVGSPHDHAPPSDRDFYSRPQYLMQQPSSAAGSPQLGPSYHQQAQQPQPPTHRQMAFGQGHSHVASPPTQYAAQHPPHRSRQNSFDGGRYQMPVTSAPTPTHGYTPAPQPQAPPLSMQHQQPHPGQERLDPYERERRLQLQQQQDDAYYNRRRMEGHQHRRG
jgi:hypothetical protein